MEEKKYTIDELLAALRDPNSVNEEDKHKVKGLANNADTWKRIGNKDSFDELGLEGSELDSFLTEWAHDNEYSNL
tara:strand:- start:175 stop:399 length:225 start_codon:yes stop_codon:yes gene_type:complete